MTKADPAKIAMIGLGKMGSAMAAQLRDAGCDVVGWLRSEAARAAFADVGGRTAATLAELADIDVAITMVSDDAAVRQLVLDPGGLADILKAGAAHVSMSTISASLCRDLATAHYNAGQNYLTAPVFGRPEAAKAGALSIVCSGCHVVYDQLKSVLTAMGTPCWIGDQVEQASIVKSAGNQMIIATVELLGEVFALLRKAGVAEDDAHALLVERLFPGPIFNGYSARIRARQWEPPAGDFFLVRKDNSLCLAAADELAVALPLVRFLRDRIDQVIDAGEGKGDVSTLARYCAREAGLGD